MTSPDAVAPFEQERPRLQAIAYAMTGQVMDAEDLVQEAWLRWHGADRAAITNPAAWLTTVVSRLAIDRLRSARHRRETYVGPWLPEPLVSSAPPGPAAVGADPAEVVAYAESLSMSFLTALERLNAVERAVLLLRDVFDVDYADIAAVVARTPDNCRQIARRARDRAGRPRDPGRDVDVGRDVLLAVVAAVSDGDLQRLRSLLAADIVLWSDGGSATRAARHPIIGAERVGRFLLGVAGNARPGDRMAVVTVNGDPGLYLQRDGHPYGVLALAVDEGMATGVHLVVNPDKLGHLAGLPAPIPLVGDVD